MYYIYIQIKRLEIQQLLENDEIIEILNCNSSQHLQQSQSIKDSNLVTWKHLLNCCHRSLILVSKLNIVLLNIISNYFYLLGS